MRIVDWDESRLTALRLSNILVDNIQQTQGRSSTVGNISLVVPNIHAVDLDLLHHTAAQKMLDFLTSDQFDGGTQLRIAALEAAVKTRTAPNLLHMLVNHSFTAEFRTKKQTAYHNEISSMEKKIESLKSQQERKPSPHTKDAVRLLRVQLDNARKKNFTTVPSAIVPQVWGDVISDTITTAEKALSVGAAYVRNPNEAIKSQGTLSPSDIVSHREKTRSQSATTPALSTLGVKF